MQNIPPIDLHESEKRLIEVIRSMKTGEIEVIKIQNGLPIIYKIALGSGDFNE